MTYEKPDAAAYAARMRIFLASFADGQDMKEIKSEKLRRGDVVLIRRDKPAGIFVGIFQRLWENKNVNLQIVLHSEQFSEIEIATPFYVGVTKGTRYFLLASKEEVENEKP